MRARAGANFLAFMQKECACPSSEMRHASQPPVELGSTLLPRGKEVMKRILLVVLVCLLPLSALGSEAFILDIPLRFNTQQETGDAKVLLELSAAPTGSQLVVNNGTTLNLGDTNVMIAGDSVSFTAGSAANTALIEYKPLSNFSGDFCNAVATEKQIPMRFAGAQDITGYRVATYIVASPAAECSQVSKHTGDTPAFLTPNDDGVAPALDADYKGRFTYDVALVLDKSGSMSELPPGANGGPTKIEYLKSAVQAFVGNWDVMDAPIGNAEWSHDRLSLVFFDSTAAAQMLAGADAPANVFLQRGSNAWEKSSTRRTDWLPAARPPSAPASTRECRSGKPIRRTIFRWS